MQIYAWVNAYKMRQVYVLMTFKDFPKTQDTEEIKLGQEIK
jgi:hypothetical protein